MTIDEMHIQFRVLGQQMGLQLVNAILPESIDAFLNDAIVEKVRSILTTNSQHVFEDKVKTKVFMTDTSIGAINALRTLYKKSTFKPNYGKFDINDYEQVFVYTSAAIKYVESGKYHKARIIDYDKLEDTLNDYLNRASKDHPVISIYSDSVGKPMIDYFTDGFEPYSLELRFIQNPDVVKYDTISCNLPAYLHHEIVENAVKKFQQSIASTKPIIANNN